MSSINLEIYFESNPSKHSMRHAYLKPIPRCSWVKLLQRLEKTAPQTFYGIPLLHKSFYPTCKEFLELPKLTCHGLLQITIQSGGMTFEGFL